jgi:hypothetical protein
MNETDMTIQRFREDARQGGFEFIALGEDGYLVLCGIPPTGPAVLGYAPAESEEAADLVRRAVEEFGIHYLTPAELAGRETELHQEMELLRNESVSRTLNDESVRSLAERRLRRKHALLHCTFPTPEHSLFEAWLCEGDSWESDHPAIPADTLSQAVRAFLNVLKGQQ